MSSFIPRPLIGQVRDDNANWDLTTRPAMFPFLADYTNRDTGEHAGGLAVPSMVTEPMNALMRLVGTPNNPGTFTQGPDYPGNSENMRTLLETFLGGNATRGMGAVERGAAELPMRRAAEVSSIPMVSADPGIYRGFHGSRSPAGVSPTNADMYWASPDANIASDYAMDSARSPSVAPADFNFTNPARIDAGGRAWGDIPFEADYRSTPELAAIARARGHDGLIIDNVFDPPSGDMGSPGSPTTVMAALKRGTVTSPLTGETLFSDNLPSLWGSALQGQQNQTYPNALFGF